MSKLNKVIKLFIFLLFLVFTPEAFASTTSFYTYEAPGRSVTSMVDDGGNSVNTYSYDSFGNIKSENEASQNNFKYVGEQYDQETDLIYLRSRYYSPSLGRFISRDPVPGFVSEPQSINPYVYCKNNPVNFIDPSGKWVGAVAGAIAGIAWGLGSTIVGDIISGEVSSGYEYAANIVGGAVGGAVSGGTLNPVLGGAAGAAVSNLIEQWGKSTTTVNYQWDVGSYITDVTLGAVFGKVADVLTPSVSGALPTTLSTSLFGAHAQAEYFADFQTSIYEGFVDALGIPGGISSLVNTAFGGVSLSTTANLMLNIDDIAGATYDEATGQVIFFGQENASLPQMDLDDLAVAINSVYKKEEDPGVSIGTEASDRAGYMKVRYDGATAGTEFGEGMFESDRQLKILSLGKDNETGQSVSSGVSGYKNMLDRYREAGGNSFPEGESSDRMWFVPKEIVLSKSADDNDMVYDSVVMELLTESKFEENVSDNPVAEGFADHFTQHYQEFAAERPILKELERLGKIVGVVKWIKDNDIPFDLSFVENYTPEYFDTDEYTPATTVSTSWTEGDKIYTFEMTGGVAYTRPNEYVDDSQGGGVADATSQAALDQRPAETDFSWDFQASESLTAVAQSLNRSRKDGNVRRRETDMSFPVEGDFPLELTRYYNSFSDKTSGFGLGWKTTPYELRFPADKQTFSFGDQGLSFNVYHKIFLTDRAAGREDLYYLLGIDNNNVPIYARDGGADILYAFSDGTFRLDKKDNSQTQFDSSGALTRLTDKNGIFISYSYSNGTLSSIVHQDGRAITLSLNGNTVASTQGPGGRVLSYTYNANGDLETVTNQEGQTTVYRYESDRRLKEIVDARRNIIFQANYDAYNRASAQTIGLGANYSSEFNLSESESTTHGPNNTRLTKLFDEQYRVTQSENTLASKVDITYAGDFGPETITDTKGNITQYAYDSHGNLSYIRDSKGNESWFYFDSNDNLVAKRDSRGFDTVYGYDEKNRLTTLYNRAVLNIDAEGNVTGFSYDPENITTLDYDPVNGNLLSLTDAQGKSQNFTYDSNGMPTVISKESGYQAINTFDSLSRITAISNAAGESVAFGYNDADQITTMTTPAGQIEYTYDPNNNIDKVFDAKNNPTDYDYDANNNLNRVTDAQGGATTYAYDVLSNLTQINLPNGTIKGQEFDELNRPILERNVVINPAPRIGVVTKQIDFGSVALGQSTNASFSIFNVGDKTLNITNISSNNSSFVAGTTTGTINPGDALNVNVTFNANTQGQQSAVLTLSSDDAKESTLTISLTADVTLPSLNLRARSQFDGILLEWDQYNDLGAFNNYRIYRSTSPITNIDTLTPIATITNIATITYVDKSAQLNSVYYYAVVAFNSSGQKLTEVESLGPITFLNIGNVGTPLEINSSATEKNPASALNTRTGESFLVYERGQDIYGQLISAAGQKIGSEFAIHADSVTERNPKVTYNSSSNEYFVVFEYDYYGNGSLYQILWQRVSAGGAPVGNANFVLSFAATQINPHVVYNSQQNRYLATFEAEVSGDGYEDIIRVLLDGNGAVINFYYAGAQNAARLKYSQSAYNSVRNSYLMAFEYREPSQTSYSYLLFVPIDANNQAGSNLAFTANTKNFSPKAVYNPDNDEFAVIWQNNYYGDNRVSVGAFPGNVSSGTVATYNLTGQNMQDPAIAYTNGRQEYLFSFTQNSGSEYNIQAQRISHGDLKLLTQATIAVAAVSAVTEQKSAPIYNAQTQEFSIGYEYNGVDLRVQRVGEVHTIIGTNPTSLDFGSDLTEKTLQATNTGGTSYFTLTNTVDQEWLDVSPRSVLVIGGPPATTSLKVTVDRTGLALGNYSGNLKIDYQEGTVNIPVAMSVVNQAPSVPSSPTPSNGAVNQSDIGSPLTVTMSWSASDPNGDPLRYDVYFSDNQSLVASASSSVQVSSNQVSTSYKSSPLEYSKNYYWRIKAKDEQNAESLSAVWQFTTIAILAPILNSYTPDPTQNKKPTLSWQAVSGAAKYHLQIDNNSDFSSPVVDNAGLTSTSYTAATDLPEGRIYWRVSSIDNSGRQGNYSQADDFLIDATAPAVPTLNAVSPDPTNNRRPTLNWQTVTDAVNYHIQISRSADFSTSIVDSHVSAVSFTPTTDLPEGSIYWRVSSLDLVGNESPFSSSDHFTVDISAPAQVTGLNVAKEGNNVQLSWNLWTDTAGDFNHFNIYRETSNINNVSGLVPLSEILDIATTSYLDTTTAHAETYFYAVTAVDILGNENKNVFGAGPVLINTAPELDPIGDKNVGIDETLSFIISAQDADTQDALSYSASNFPSGASFNPSTQEFSWTPVAGQEGQYAGIRFEVTDGIDIDFENILIVVGEFNHPPILDSIGSKSVNENETLAFTVTASDPEGDPLAFSATNLPQGAVFDPETQEFNWTPSYEQAGTYGGDAVDTDTWVHLEFQRSSGNFDILLDGIPQNLSKLDKNAQDLSALTDFEDLDNILAVGSLVGGDYPSGTQFSDGWIDEFSINIPGSEPTNLKYKLLISGEGQDGSTSFTDSAENHPITAVGDAQIDTEQKIIGTSSMLFDGNGDYLTMSDSEDWNFGANDFTIDFWVKPTISGVSQFFIQQGTPLNSALSFRVDPDNKLYFVAQTEAGATQAYYITESAVSIFQAIDNGWHHIELVRNGADIDIFVDGISQILYEQVAIGTNSLANGTTNLVVGATLEGTYAFNGWIDELTVKKFVDPDLKLGISADGTDGSQIFSDTTGQHSITAVGDAQIDTAQSHSGGSSVLFDGNGDYLTIPDSEDWNFGANDFTIDFWVRFNSLEGYQTFFRQFQSNGNEWVVRKNSNNVLVMYFQAGGVEKGNVSTRNPVDLNANQWYHLEFKRNGSNGLIVVDGISQAMNIDTPFGNNDFGNITTPLIIGADELGTSVVNGWIDELTVKKFVDPDLKIGISADGTDGSQIFSDTTGQHPVTALGNAQIDTSESQSGGASALLDGQGDYLTVPDSEDWHFGTKDFDIGFWVRLNAKDKNQTLVSQVDALKPGNFLQIGINDQNRLFFYFKSPSTYVYYGTSAPIHFEVSDGFKSDSENIKITVNNVNAPPVLDSIGPKSVDENAVLTFRVTASDSDAGDTLTYSASNLPEGATFDPLTQEFTWMPSYEQGRVYANIHFEVTDGADIDAEDITITVNNVNRAPILNPIGNKTVDENQTLTFTVTASDLDGNPLVYSASNLPAGSTFDSLTQIFTWTPTYEQSGMYANVHFGVSDGTILDSEDISITVNGVNRAPVLNPIGNKSVAENATLTFAVTASDSDAGDMLTYSAANLPEGATFDPGTRIFNWTPTYAQAGEYSGVHFEVSDGQLIDSEGIVITVNDVDNEPPQTVDDYDGLWHKEDISILLTATDDKSGVLNTYYKINDGQMYSVSIQGQPVISAEGSSNTLEYWSVDNQGNEELPHKRLSEIKLDKTSPVVTILSPENGDIFNEGPVTVSGMTEDGLSGIKNVEIEVKGEVYTPTLQPDGSFSMTDVEISGFFNTIKVSAWDAAGNSMKKKVLVYLGWKVHLDVDIPKFPPLINGAAGSQIILNYLKNDTDEELTQEKIYEYGRYYNYPGNITLKELDPQAMDYVLGHFDPYDFVDTTEQGNPDTGYDFRVESFKEKQFVEYLRDITLGLASPEFLEHDAPAAIPAFGRYDHWLVLNGAAASESPLPELKKNPWHTPAYRAGRPDLTLFGFWFVDSAFKGIGSRVFVTPQAAKDTYFLPLKSLDIHKGQYVQVTAPFDIQSKAKVRIEEPPINEDHIQFIESLQISDAKKDFSIDWENIIHPALLTDKDFRKALKESHPRGPFKVRRIDQENSFYYLMLFDTYIKGELLTSAAIILDAKDGSFREASWAEKPIHFDLMNEEEAIQYVLSENPDLLVEKLSAELVWEPQGKTSSPYYPYWKISSDSVIYFVVSTEEVDSPISVSIK